MKKHFYPVLAGGLVVLCIAAASVTSLNRFSEWRGQPGLGLVWTCTNATTGEGTWSNSFSGSFVNLTNYGPGVVLPGAETIFYVRLINGSDIFVISNNTDNSSWFTIAPLSGQTMIKSNLQVTGNGNFRDLYVTNASRILTNYALHTTVTAANLHNIAIGKGWTNDLGARADIVIEFSQTDAATGDPGLAFTNTATGEAWTNRITGGLVQTRQGMLYVLDVSTNDYGSFTDVSTGSGSAQSIKQAWWKLK